MAFIDLKPRPKEDAAGGAFRWRWAGRALVVLVPTFVAGWGLVAAGDEEPPVARRVLVPTPPPPVIASDTLRRGETLAELLDRQGFSPAEAHMLIESVRPVRRPRTLRPGLVAHFSAPPGGRPDRVWLELDPDQRVHLEARGDGWSVRLDSVPVAIDTLRLAGFIRSTLWESELEGDVERLGPEEFAQLVWGLSSQVYAWKIDFSRDIWEGDAFRVVVEREVRPDGSVRSFRFLATEFRNRGRRLPAIPFRRPDGRLEYYDTEGESLRGVFLRAPLEFRVTSGFNLRRYHPILKRRRPHLGTDYGAPAGAPVQATADGVVARAGTWGGYGRMVEIRHSGGIRTRYAHLSRVMVRAGQRVGQGEVIGRVGASGLATAPHLHYEFLQHGAHRNPASVDLPSAPALEDEYRPLFRQAAASALRLLEGVPLPGESPQPESPPAGARVAD